MALINTSYAIPLTASSSAGSARAPVSLVERRAAGEHVLADAPRLIAANAGTVERTAERTLDGTGNVVDRRI